MKDIVCPKCYHGDYTRLTNNGGCICDNCNYVFRLEESFKPIPRRKFQQLSYEEVQELIISFAFTRGSNTLQRQLQTELKEELEIRG